MDTTGLLSLAAALVVAAGLYRLARWRWRPRLEPGDLLVERHSRLIVRVLNTGARTARSCRARLVAVERLEGGSWRRLPDSDRLPAPRWPDGEETAEIRPGGSRTLVVLEDARLPPGRYRITLAVIDGEERMRTYEVVLPPAVSDAPGADPGSVAGEDS